MEGIFLTALRSFCPHLSYHFLPQTDQCKSIPTTRYPILSNTPTTTTTAAAAAVFWTIQNTGRLPLEAFSLLIIVTVFGSIFKINFENKKHFCTEILVIVSLLIQFLTEMVFENFVKESKHFLKKYFFFHKTLGKKIQKR